MNINVANATRFLSILRESAMNLQTCLKCGSVNTISKIISSSGFRLSGTGWYGLILRIQKNINKSQTNKNKSDSKAE